MAKKPEKKSTKSSLKLRKKRVSKKAFLPKKNILIIVSVFFMVLLISFGSFLGQDNGNKKVHIDKLDNEYSTKDLLKDLSKIKTENRTVASEKPYHPKDENITQEEKSIKKQPDEKQNTILAYRSKKPKLVIIIDDVHTRSQLKAILDLNMSITPSIFPPYKIAPKSNLLSKGLKHYMIHLPMESESRQFNKQYKTLKTSFTKEQMENRVKELRRLFPTAKYVNNHTGSVFTKNYYMMKTVYALLRKQGFVFIDSRTTSLTKVKKIAHEFGDAYVAKDLFIDNKQTIFYIHNQLKKVVNIAKKKGYAIAIGHPHKATMRALASSKQILKDVTLVYIDDIYKKGKK